MQKKKGISLIVLVITVIIMIILASAVIISLNNNGVIDRAKSATDNYLGKQIGEQLEIARLEFNLKKHEAAYANKTEADYIEECLESALGKTVTVNKLGKNYKVEVEGNNKEYLCKYDGNVISRDKVEKMAVTSVYAKLEDGVLYLRSTKPNDDYKRYTDCYSIASNWENETPASVTKVVIEEQIAPNGLGQFFRGFSNLVEIENIKNLHAENATNMYAMFDGCNSLTSLDLSSFTTEKSTRMDCMFRDCSLLTNLDLSFFETESVTDMSCMFQSCSSLTKLDLTSIDTSNAGNFFNMFYNCSSLTDLDLSSFNTQNVTNMASMFLACRSLKKVNVSGFNTQNVTNMTNMFSQCISLVNLDLSNFKTSKVTNMAGMFAYCSSITRLNLTSFDTTEVTTMQSMFQECSSLTDLDISSFNTNKVTNPLGMYAVFTICTALKKLNLGKNFVIHDEAVYMNTRIIIGTPGDIKITTTVDIASQVKKYSTLTDANFIIID